MSAVVDKCEIGRVVFSPFGTHYQMEQVTDRNDKMVWALVRLSTEEISFSTFYNWLQWVRFFILVVL